jgi:hypothetical protein
MTEKQQKTDCVTPHKSVLCQRDCDNSWLVKAILSSVSALNLVSPFSHVPPLHKIPLITVYFHLAYNCPFLCLPVWLN